MKVLIKNNLELNKPECYFSDINLKSKETARNITVGSSISSMKEALLLIDIQNDYFPGGKMELVGMEEAAKKAAELLKAFRNADKPVFFIKHLSTRSDATFLIPETRESIFILA